MCLGVLIADVVSNYIADQILWGQDGNSAPKGGIGNVPSREHCPPQTSRFMITK